MNTLTHFRLCPRSRSIRLALQELGLETAFVEEKPWEWRAEFLALNPAGELPVLQTEGGPPLRGAYAISECLADVYDGDGDEHRGVQLFPGSAAQRAEVRRLVDWFHGKFEREVTREVLEEKVYARLRGGDSIAPDAEILRAVRANLRHHMSYLNFLAHERGWLAGDELSFADLAAAGHLSSLDYLGEVGFDGAPAAKSWYQRIKSRPSFRAILADRLPGTPPPASYADLDF